MSTMFCHLKGDFSDLTVYDDHVTISRTRKHIKNKKRTTLDVESARDIYYSEISHVNFKPANVVVNGYIQFVLPGHENQNPYAAKTQYNGFFQRVSYIYSDTVFIIHANALDLSADTSIGDWKFTNQAAERAYTYIVDRLKVCKNESIQPVAETSAADELRKFKELLDDGIITQEEFAEKKKQILSK